jgi:hypothetical protein
MCQYSCRVANTAIIRPFIHPCRGAVGRSPWDGFPAKKGGKIKRKSNASIAILRSAMLQRGPEVGWWYKIANANEKVNWK